MRAGLVRIEKRKPFEMLGFDCDNGSEFLNEILEAYLLKKRKSIEWTRSRAYKKNDQAHVEQKNFTHVRQLLGYGRYGDLDLKIMVDELYEKAWLPMRNYFTPVMKLLEKQRIGGKVRNKYDTLATPCDRLLACPKVSEEIKAELHKSRSALDPMDLAEEVERRLAEIFSLAERIDEERWEEMERAGEPQAKATAVIFHCLNTLLTFLQNIDQSNQTRRSLNPLKTYAKSKRSRFITLFQAATKSFKNLSCASAQAYTSAKARNSELEPKIKSTRDAVHFNTPVTRS